MSRREGEGILNTVRAYDFVKFTGKRFAGAEKHQKFKSESIIKGVDMEMDDRRNGIQIEEKNKKFQTGLKKIKNRMIGCLSAQPVRFKIIFEYLII
jgi:hypothetical protein